MLLRKENQGHERDLYWEKLLYGDEISAERREGDSHVKIRRKGVSGEGISYCSSPHAGLLLACLGQKRGDFQEVVGLPFCRTN